MDSGIKLALRGTKHLHGLWGGSGVKGNMTPPWTVGRSFVKGDKTSRECGVGVA